MSVKVRVRWVDIPIARPTRVPRDSSLSGMSLRFDLTRSHRSRSGNVSRAFPRGCVRPGLVGLFRSRARDRPARVDQSARAAASDAISRVTAGCARALVDDEGRESVQFAINSYSVPSRTGTVKPQRAAVSAFSAGHNPCPLATKLRSRPAIDPPSVPVHARCRSRGSNAGIYVPMRSKE